MSTFHSISSEVDTPSGSGITSYSFRRGIKLIKTDINIPDNYFRSFELSVPSFELSFCSSGIAENDIQSDVHRFEPGQSHLGLMHPLRANVSYPSSGQLSYIQLFMTPVGMNECLQDIGCASHVDFNYLLGNNHYRFMLGTIEPSTALVLNQIKDSLREGTAVNRLYLECKLLELLALYLDRLVDQRGDGEATSTMRMDDKDKIHLAATLLIQRLDNPPSLLELAKLVGMNDFKLKKGFRQLHDTTVYGYLRDRRMEQALRLLEGRQANVSEAAFAVGYTNVSHFSAAFREKYGINPSKLL
ncbi:AraC family transcriptional regulator [Paenibacillus sp. FSL H8-0537]|uniref:helix-turn-helix transcriptional regulator n=1 Tax=Paenibacillus sp. FSL H8-0537 TaxID=2921399 RepID=UPI0031011058